MEFTKADLLQQETYEPLWEDLLSRSTVKIRAIWIADCSHQGASGIANENEQGDDREYWTPSFANYVAGSRN